MDYHKQPLVVLQNIARNHNPPIKHYYIKTRLELIELLSMKELPESFILEKKTITQLRKEAREKGHTQIWKLKKAELIALLYPSSKQNNQDHNHTEKHDDPQKSESK